MNHHPETRGRGGQTRRQFIRKAGALATMAAAGGSLLPMAGIAAGANGGVFIVLDPSGDLTGQRPVRWAAEELRDRLQARGVEAGIVDRFSQVPASRECIVGVEASSASGRQMFAGLQIKLPDAPESYGLARVKRRGRRILAAAGGDTRGLMFALLELADRVSLAPDPLAAIQSAGPETGRPANAIRSVSRAFVSDVEDKTWFRDRGFWKEYLTTLAANRFNRFHLAFGIGYDFTTNISDCYFHFAYPFLISVPGYNVRAEPLPDAERDFNLEMLRFISDETARRGMDFQLGLWTHAYRWTDSPRANYVITGLTPQTHPLYCRDALQALLGACPSIRGVTFRIHGESGVPEGHYDFWKTVFDGIRRCGRQVEIDMHAKGMDQAMIDVALGTGMPVTISPKFWAEHMGLPYMQGAIRPLEMPHAVADNNFFSRSSGSRSFLRYGYGDLLSENRRYKVLHRMWPGTQRLLLWGDPQTAAGYGRVAGFCGSNGIELFEPLYFKGRKGSGLPGGRDAYADARLKPARDFEKYLYTYRVWGRNLYDPDGPAEAWQRLLRRSFGRGAGPMEAALSQAGRILPLVTTAHCPSAANNNYWPEMYFNMAIVDPHRRNPYGDTPSPKRFGTVCPLDPEFFLGCDEFADELLGAERSGKYSPAWVARQLESAASSALAQLRRAQLRAPASRNAAFQRWAIDVTIQSGLGHFFAAKFRSGVLHGIYLRSRYRPALAQALEANRAARAAWAELANAARTVYRPDVTFGPEYFQRGHWLDRLPALDVDIADMEKLLNQSTGSASDLEPGVVERAIRAVLEGDDRGGVSPTVIHTPPASFRRGAPVSVAASLPKSDQGGPVSGWHLCFRRINQAELWRRVDMQRNGADYGAVIPGDYTESPFPLQYYFQIRTVSGGAALYPGLEPGWRGQPYFFIRQAPEA